MFIPQTPILEHVFRGAALYFGILILLRIMPRRSGGSLTTMDLIFALLITNAAAPSLGDYRSLTDGAVLILTIMGCNYLVNALSFRLPILERLISAPPLQIVRNGQLLRRNMRREFLTAEELMDHLRQQGIEDLQEVKDAFVESEGEITVIRRKENERDAK